MQAVDHKPIHKEILRTEFLDDSFAKLKNELKQQIESGKTKTEMIILELVNDAIEEYLNHSKNNPFNDFRTTRRFDVNIKETEDSEILLKPDFWVNFTTFRSVLSAILKKKQFLKEMEVKLDEVAEKTADIIFSFPALKNML